MNVAPIAWRRLLPVVLLILATAIVLEAHERPEIVPPHNDLADFPMQVNTWSGTSRSLTPDELAVLGPGEFLMRDYQRSATEPPVNLYIAYFPSQRTGDTIHSPKNCLPGAGWSPDESTRIPIQSPDGASILVNRYIVSKGEAQALVLYWYQSHGRVTPSEYWAKIFLVSDAIRMNRTDGALLRLVTPLLPGEAQSAAETRTLAFAHQILPLLDTYIPR